MDDIDRKWWKVFFKLFRSTDLWLSPHWVVIACMALINAFGSINRAIAWFVFLAMYTFLIAWMLTTQACIRLRRDELRQEWQELKQEQQNKLRLLHDQIRRDLGVNEMPKSKSPWFLGEWQQNIDEK